MLKILIVALLLGLPVYAQAQTSDDQSGGCGSGKDGWDVKTVKNHPPAPNPQDGKALVYVVQTMWVQPGLVIGSDKATTRVGVDGAWVGANHGDSYFFFRLIRASTAFARTGNQLSTCAPAWLPPRT